METGARRLVDIAFPTASSTFFPRMCLAFWRAGLAVRVYLTIPLPGALALAESGGRARVLPFD